MNQSGFFGPDSVGFGFDGVSQAESIGAERPGTGAVATRRRPSADRPTIRIGPGRAQSQALRRRVTDEADAPDFLELTAGAITPSKCSASPTSIGSR